MFGSTPVWFFRFDLAIFEDVVDLLANIGGFFYPAGAFLATKYGQSAYHLLSPQMHASKSSMLLLLKVRFGVVANAE